jgi:hypothetical protein
MSIELSAEKFFFETKQYLFVRISSLVVGLMSTVENNQKFRRDDGQTDAFFKIRVKNLIKVFSLKKTSAIYSPDIISLT